MFRTNRRLGWRPDVRDPNDYHFDRLGLGVPPPEKDRKSLRVNSGPVLEQGQTSTCVLQAVAGAVVTREILSGLPAVLPSRLFMYYNSRNYHGSTRTDGGTFIRTAVSGLRWYGAPDETIYPFSTNVLKVNKAPPWVVYNRAFGRRGANYYRIFETGEDRVRAMKAAILEGLPIVFGTGVSKDFLRNKGPRVLDAPLPSEPRAGGHCMLFTGFYYSSDGLLFEVKNSWGPDWRSDGFVYFTEDYVRNPTIRDLTVIDEWKGLKNARR